MQTATQVRRLIEDRKSGFTKKSPPPFYVKYRLGHYVVLQELQEAKSPQAIAAE